VTLRKKTDVIDLLIFLLISLVLTIMLFLIYNQLITARQVYDNVAEEQAALSRDQDRLNQLVLLKDRVGEQQERMARYDHLVPQSPEESSLLNDIKVAASYCGLQLAQIQLEERINGQDYVEMPFKFTLKGRYQSLLNLLVEMENSPRAIRIDEVNISKDQENGPDIEAEIYASAFYTAGD